MERHNSIAGTSAVLRTVNFFRDSVTIFSGVEDFEVKNNYLFASRKTVSVFFVSS